LPPAQPCIRFNELLIKSIDDTITALLSKQVAEAIYSHLERIHSVSKFQIPDHLDVLSSALEQTFGRPSSTTISKAIAKALYEELGLDFSARARGTLTGYVDEAKMRLRERGIQL